VRSLSTEVARPVAALLLASFVLCDPTSAAAQLRPPPPGEPAAQVRFEPDEPGLELLGATRTYQYAYLGWRYRVRRRLGWVVGYVPICDQACVTSFSLGPHHLALSKDGGPPAPSEDYVSIAGPSRLRASYVDRSAVRATGWVVGVAGVIGGVVMIASSGRRETVCDLNGVCFRRSTSNEGLLFGGIGVVFASAIVGGVLAAQGDTSRIHVEPLQLGDLHTDSDLALPERAAQGAALSLHF
jgi:hypothetical protein